jgi:hypothetical protein
MKAWGPEAGANGVDSAVPPASATPASTPTWVSQLLSSNLRKSTVPVAAIGEPFTIALSWIIVPDARV